MGRSSLTGVERAAAEPIGRDVDALGPSDSSDSGSDMAGIEDLDRADPGEPVDVAMDTDVPRTYAPIESLDGRSADATGTGERRSAGGDGGREAGDISVDRVIDLNDPDEDEDPDLAFVDRLADEADGLTDLEEADGADEEAEARAEAQARAEDRPAAGTGSAAAPAKARPAR